MLYCHLQHHKDTIIETQEDFFRKIFTSQFICKVRKGYSRFSCERELETEKKQQYFDPHSYVSFSFSRCSTGGPEAQRPTLLNDGFLYCILSASSLDPNSSGPQWPLWPDVALPTTSRLSPSLTLTSWLLSWLSYIIVQRTLNRLLDLWNHMFDRHQAEITVMKFTGHSLPVYQSMSVPWKFFYLFPFHQPISAHAISSHNCH